MVLKEKYFTISEAAEKLGVTRQTLSRWVKQRKFPVERIGRETLIEKARLQTYTLNELQDDIARLIIRLLAFYVEVAYQYTRRDIIKLVNIGKNGVFHFSVVRKDGTEERVNVRTQMEMSKEARGHPVFRIKEIWQVTDEGKVI